MAGIPVSRAELHRLYWIEEKSLAEIGQMYNRQPTTVHQWMRKFQLPTRSRQEQAYKLIQGVLHKKCRGHLHDGGWEWLPVTEFWRDSNNRFRSRCRNCESDAQGSEPRVELERVYFAVDELARRLGNSEAARRIGISPEYIPEILNKRVKHLKRKTARSAIAALAEVRANNEVRHKDSIKHGAYLRGREEKTPVDRRDFYKPTGDSDLEMRRKYRSENVEVERERERGYKAKAKARKDEGLTAA